jgi:hypothetical protein
VLAEMLQFFFVLLGLIKVFQYFSKTADNNWQSLPIAFAKIAFFMKRRAAVKNLGLAFAGLVSLPAWAQGWTPESIGQQHSLPLAEEDLLAEIVETIIPQTTTPGAKSLKVHQFALRMINDCYGEAAQASLVQGLQQTDQLAQQGYEKSFTACDARQRTDILTRMGQSADPAARQFYDMIKNLTIRGYMNSEYVMLNLLDYKMAPGFYHGCVPVTP